MATDALGNQITIGGTYGYSNRNNGILTVIIGTAEKLTEKGNVTLQITDRGGGLYGANVKREKPSTWYHTKKKVSVVSNTLFPLASDVQLNWKDEE